MIQTNSTIPTFQNRTIHTCPKCGGSSYLYGERYGKQEPVWYWKCLMCERLAPTTAEDAVLIAGRRPVTIVQMERTGDYTAPAIRIRLKKKPVLKVKLSE